MTDNPRSISVTGTGSAEAAPDLLTLSIGVECRRENVAEAYGDAGNAVGRHHRRRSGSTAWTAPDMSTSGLNVRAEVNWQEGRGQTVTGYLASSMLTVRIRELSGSSEIIAAAVAAGGDAVRLNGLSLGFADPVGRGGPGPGGRLAGRPHHGAALRRPLRDRSWARSCPSPSTSGFQAPDPRGEDAAGRGGESRSPSRPASPASPPPSASSGN